MFDRNNLEVIIQSQAFRLRGNLNAASFTLPNDEALVLCSSVSIILPQEQAGMELLGRQAERDGAAWQADRDEAAQQAGRQEWSCSAGRQGWSCSALRLQGEASSHCAGLEEGEKLPVNPVALAAGTRAPRAGL